MCQLVAMLAAFVASRPRSLAEVLREALQRFPQVVEQSESGSASSSSEDEADADAELMMEELPEQPEEKKARLARQAIPEPSAFELPTAVARGPATQRLCADFASIMAANTERIGFRAAPINKNLYRWKVEMVPLADDDSPLFQDLRKSRQSCIELEMLFPSEYPQEPPFIRVIQPRFAFHTGHVTIGGSICMDMLTNSGWSPVNTIESTLLQIRTEMTLGGGRLDLKNNTPYTMQEARQAFVRVATQHKWSVPNHAHLDALSK